MKKIFPILLLFILSSCSNAPQRILIIGDSISLGYTPHVKEMLGDKAIVVHNQGNAQHTGTGLEKIEEWIGEEEWDIVQFNWGLWDLCYRHDSSKVQGKRDKIHGKVTFSPEEYASNLDSLVKLMKSLTRAKLIFVSTSYVPEGEAGRFAEDALVYNEVAFTVMEKHRVPVNDIYEFSKTVHSEHSTEDDNVHYTDEGYQQLATIIIEGLAKNSRLRTYKVR